MISYIFPGQGSQFKGMGAELFDLFPEQEKEADEILGYSIRALCCEDSEGNLNQTQYTQPAIYVVSALSYLQEVQKFSVQPNYLAGHSLGEYNALNAAGALSFGDGLRLVKKRGELMSHAKHGAMAAILNISDADVSELLDANRLTNVDIANYNARNQIVISGVQEEVADSQTHIESAGGVFIPLNTSGAFHSRLMEPAGKEFSEYLRSFKFGDISIPVISNVTGQPYVQSEIADHLSKQITGSVLWFQTIESLLDSGVTEFKELGAGDVLSKLLTKIKSSYNAAQKKQRNAPVSPIQSHTSNRREDDQHTAERIVNEWNKKHRVGEFVSVTGLNGRFTTRSEAKTLFGFRPVIYLDGLEGYLPLSGIS